MNQIERLEIKISKLLRLGVLISGSLLSVGLIMMLSQKPESFAVFQTYQATAFKQTILLALEQKDYAKLVTFSGLIVLISLPLIRIFLTALLLFKQKELILASIASGVFFTLISSFFLGLEF